MNFLKDKKILVIVTGGIACYKALDLIRRLQEKEGQVECVLTSNAMEFVKAITFESLLGKKIKSNLFSLDQEKNMSHIKLANDAEIILVAPCTANFISKISNGVADDLVSTIMLASNKPTLIAPSMNVKMWENQNTVSNVLKLKEQGIHFIGPNKGEMACGEIGYGKLASVEEIKKHILEAIPDASIEIKDLMGDNNHYSAVIKSKIFKGMNKIDQHKLVYKSLKGKMGNELHALSITTKEE